MVTNQWETTGRELNADLMTSAGVQPHMNQAFLAVRQTVELQTGVFDTLALLFNGENLVFSTVFEEKIFPVSRFGGSAMDQGYILLHHGTFLNSPGKLRRCLFSFGEDHDAAYIFVQSMDGVDLAADGSRNFMFGIYAHRLDDDDEMLVRIKCFHISYQ